MYFKWPSSVVFWCFYLIFKNYFRDLRTTSGIVNMLQPLFYSSLFINFLFVSLACSLTDILRPVLCGHQPLQEPAHLFREHHWDVQREEEARDASTHLCHLWVSIPLHASRYDTHLLSSWISLLSLLILVVSTWFVTSRQIQTQKYIFLYRWLLLSWLFLYASVCSFGREFSSLAGSLGFGCIAQEISVWSVWKVRRSGRMWHHRLCLKLPLSWAAVE